MKYSILFAALLAVVIAGCGKKEQTPPVVPVPIPESKPQAGEVPKAEPPKAEAPTSGPAGGEAKPAEGVAAPAGGQPAKKENK